MTASDSNIGHGDEQRARPWARSRTICPSMMASENGISSSSQFSKRLVSAVGFSKRMRAVGVEEAAAVGAEFLDRFLERDRA